MLLTVHRKTKARHSSAVAISVFIAIELEGGKVIKGIQGLAKCAATHLIALSTEQMTLLRCDAVLLTLHVSRTKLTFLITVTEYIR